MTQNGTLRRCSGQALPDYLIIHTEVGWTITDRHGNLPFIHVKIRVATALEMLTQAGASFQIIDPQQHKTKGTP